MLHAEWIDYLGWYRWYDPECPENAIAYIDDLGEVEQARAKELGYDGIIEDLRREKT